MKFIPFHASRSRSQGFRVILRSARASRSCVGPPARESCLRTIVFVGPKGRAFRGLIRSLLTPLQLRVDRLPQSGNLLLCLLFTGHRFAGLSASFSIP